MRPLMRRVALATAIVLGISVGMPSGAAPSGGSFPLSWLTSWLTQSATWAAFGGAPTQPTGPAVGLSGYVGAGATAAQGGAGRPPVKVANGLDGYQRHDAGGRMTATVGRQGFNSATSRRDPQNSTATVDQFTNADGSVTRKAHQTPVNYRASDGSWQPIDTTLVRDDHGRWRPTANSLQVSFAGGPGQGDADQAHAMSLTLPSGQLFAYDVQGAVLGAPTVTGDTATYRQVLPHTDMTLRAVSTGVQQQFVLDSPAAAASWTFPLTLRGLSPRIAADGGIELVDAAGTRVAWIPHGRMYDSHADATGEPASSSALTYEIVRDDAGTALKVSADQAWLSDPARVYPVTIDPDVSTVDDNGDVYVDSDTTTGSSTQNGNDLGVGLEGTNKMRSFMHFGDFGLAGAALGHITDVKLHLYLTYAKNCTATESYSVYLATEAWTVANLSTAALPGPGTGSAIGTWSGVSPSSACSNNPINHNLGTWQSVSLAPQTFVNWSVDSSTNLGLALRASETDTAAFKRFDSANWSGGQGPYLEVTYGANVAPQVDGRFPGDNVQVESLTPQLVVRAHDPDNYPAQGLRYSFVVYNTAGAQVASSGWITAASWNVPAGVLGWNSTYVYTVQVYDRIGYSDVYPGYAFSTPVPQSPLTSSLAENPGRGYDANTGNYTTTAKDAQIAGIGPQLEIARSYNSLDLRRGGAFGQGWSSVLDSQAVQKTDASGAVQTVSITYPTGQEVAFGRNADGSFTAPVGRYAVFAATTSGSTVTGYTLTDKEGSVYAFGRSAGNGTFRITSITDANGRTMTFTYDGTTGLLSKMTSAAGRTLSFTWAASTAPTVGSAHVATVTTDPPTTGGSGFTWTYTYGTYDRLLTVCPPGTTTACTVYNWANWSNQYANAADNYGPYASWRLNDAAGSTLARSGVLANAGSDNGTYSNVTLGSPAALTDSSSTSATFNGTTSSLQLPGRLITDGSYQSVALWFKTTAAGVLFSYQNKAITAGAPASITPSLYVGNDGKLHGEFYYGGTDPIASASTVADGAWHYAVLSGSGNTQSLYLDGALQGTRAGTIQVYLDSGAAYEYVGTGYIGWGWPNNPYTNLSPQPYYFSGQISDVAIYNKPISAAAVSSLYWTAKNSSSIIRYVKRPSGRTAATVEVSTVTGKVTKLTDENGGTWTMGTPTVAGDSDVYVASVLGSKPQDYWRLQDPKMVDAVNEVNGFTASYSGTMTFRDPGPFADTKALTLDGATGVVRLPTADIPPGPATPQSMGVWFKTASTTGGVLVGFSSNEITATQSSYIPALYVGSDGRLRGSYCWCGGAAPLASSATVNDGKWHYAVITRGSTGQTLFLDGAQVMTSANSTTDNGVFNYGYLGSGFVTYWPAAPSTRYFKGTMAEAGFFKTQLSAADVQAQFTASQQSVPVAYSMSGTTVTQLPMPVKTVTVIDPGGKTISYSYDLANGGRMISETDALGNVTRYGYDTGGFDNLVYDARGVWSQTVQDARGNTIQQITCQDQKNNKCSSVYYSYYLNASSAVDPRNDLMTEVRDGRSSSPTDNTYLTTHAYDAKGNPTTVTDPLGRVTSTTYTDGTTVAVNGGYAPPGLPATVTKPSGASDKIEYYANGEVARTTTPTGKIITFTYDNLGRKLTETEVTSGYPNGQTTTFSYDAQGRELTQTDPAVTNRVTGAVHTPYTTTIYDDDGNTISETFADTTGGDVARTQTVAFNSYGQKQSQTDAVGNTTSFTYDVYGNVILETEPDGGQTRHDVDAEGNVLKIWTVAFTGDPNAPVTAADKVLQSKQYDPNGRVASETDAMGWTTNYTYTDNGLLQKTTRTDGTTTYLVEQNTYDGAGNVVTKITDNGATTTAFAYDAAGRQTTTTLDPGGLNRVTTNTLSADDQVVATTSSDSTGILAAGSQLYDAEGRMLASTEYNGNPVTTPLARWMLNETTGTKAADAVGNSSAEKSATGVAWSSDHPAAGADITGSVALERTGPSGLSTSGPLLDTTRSYTVSAWVKLTGAQTGNRVALTQDGDRVSAFWLGYSYGPNKWRMMVCRNDSDSGGCVSALSDAVIASDTWTHLAGVYDASAKTVTLYVNGVAQSAPAAVSTAFGATGPLNIGIGKWTGVDADVWQGNIADAQAYQGALSTTQVDAVYGATAPSAAVTVSRTSYKVDNDGLVTSTTDPNGNVTDVSYDEAGQPAVVTGAPVTAETLNGSVTARPITYIGYDTFGDKTETVDGNGNRTVHVFDRNGREFETHLPAYTPPGSTVAINPVTSTVFDELNQVTSSTDARGKTTSYVYDQLGRVASATAPDGGVTKATYDLAGDQLSSTDPTGAKTSTTYDFLGRRITATQEVRQPAAVAYTTTYAYDTAGRLKSTQTPTGVTQSYTYNAAGEVLTSVDGAGQITGYAYDGLGRQVKTTAPDGTYTTTSYDMLSRPVGSASFAPGGGTALATGSKAYDRAGNAVSSTDARGTTTTFTYDPTGMVLSEIQPISASDAIWTSFGYDLAGNRTRFTDGRGNNYWTTYNAWNLVDSQIEPATTAYPNIADRTYTTVYNAASQPVSQILPGGVTQAYAYDDNGRITLQTGSGAEGATADRVFAYDLAGRMTSLSGPGGATTVSYDDRGLPLSVSGPSGTSSFAYNGDGAVISRTDAAGTTSYLYDTAGRLKKATNAGAGVDVVYEYTTTSAVQRLTYSSGDYRSFTYDYLHRVTGDELLASTGTSIAKIGYGWDANGNEASKTTTNFGASTITNTYSYDLADRLTSWDNGTSSVVYAYDKSGNRTRNGARLFSYDEQNRLIGDGATTYAYRARGVLSSATTGSNAVHTTADAFGQILSQEYAGGTRTYSYDALGRAVQPGFAYTGLDNDLAADATATYVRDPANAVLAEQAGSTTRMTWTDLHEDIVGQFTPTGTALDGTQTYDPLGKVVSTAGMIGSLGYQSEWTESSTGRVNMMARWYNTDTAQFDSRDSYANDPIPDSIGANRFEYGDGDPLTVTDPSGHCAWYDAICKAKAAYHATTSFVSNTYHAATSFVSNAWNWGVSKVNSARHWAEDRFERARSWAAERVHDVKHFVKKSVHNIKKYVKHKIDQGKKYLAHKYHQIKNKVKKIYHAVKQAGKAIVHAAKRVAKKIVSDVKDAYHTVAKGVKAAVKWAKSPEGAGFLAGLVIGVGCAAFTMGVGALACGALAGAVSSGLTAAMEGKGVKDVLLAAGGGAVMGVVGGALGGVGGAFIGKGLVAAKPLISKGLGTAAKQFVSVGWQEAKNAGANLIGSEARQLFTSGGVKGLAQAHAAFFKTKSIGIYGKMVKDSLPSAVPAALIQGILPGQPNGQWFPPKFSPTNAVSGILTGLFG